MIDTVKLFITKFEIETPEGFVVNTNAQIGAEGYAPHPSSRQPLLFRCLNGKEVRGIKAFCNVGGPTPFQLTIERQWSKPERTITRIEFSVPKFFAIDGKNRNAVVSVQEFRDGLAGVEKGLGAIGFRCNLASAWLSRVDLFRDIWLDRPYTDYLPLLDLIRIPGLTKRVYRETSFYWNNSQEEFHVYWKSKQLGDEEDPKVRDSRLRLFGSVLRFEYRLQRADKVRGVLGVTTLSELVKRWSELPAFFNQACLRAFLSTTPQRSTRETDLDDFETELRACQKTNRFWIRKSLARIGLRSLVTAVGSDFVEDVILRVGGWSELNRIRNDISEVRAREKPGTGSVEARADLELLRNELMTKLILEGDALRDRLLVDSLAR